MTKKLLFILLCLLVVLGVLLFLLKYFPKKYTKSVTIVQNVTKDRSTVDIFSQNNKYDFYSFMYGTAETGDTDQCRFYIKDSVGNDIDYSSLLKYNDLLCSIGMFGLKVNGFLGWYGDKGTFEKNEGKIDVVDFSNMFVRSVSYNKDKLRFVSFDKDVTRVLYKVKTSSEYDDALEYQLYTLDGKLLRKYSFGKSGASEFFDYTNNGILIASRNFLESGQDGSSNVIYAFYFLSYKTNEVTSLLKTDVINLLGRGCGQASLSSVPGKIIFDTGNCFELPKEYFVSPGIVEFNLLK